ncbi:MAG: low molecular weight phosphotyrosine protein phosphatase [Saprospiraceae bacterium]|jgi:protein-tyrosine phosphatase|nr:low molecular weight phosphotyrosine protein phosphatase [Saprospiraceae bacterium]MBP9210062.1 low molecular weight phosphotyrosine protein phosphatase [Saprospiraceae bacterium]MBV6472909.1 Low molecular weight protein-tyrosine-phosphatase YfkJ [Saprospiraceae bacterium]
MRILMVCLGNICRSPLAQGVLEREIASRHLPWSVDAAGTSRLHEGEAPDLRAIRTASRYGMDISRQRSRMICSTDFERFDLLLAMDRQNLDNLKSVYPHPQYFPKIQMLMSYSADWPGADVPDPYYDNRFEHALHCIESGCLGLVTRFGNG